MDCSGKQSELLPRGLMLLTGLVIGAAVGVWFARPPSGQQNPKPSQTAAALCSNAAAPQITAPPTAMVSSNTAAPTPPPGTPAPSNTVASITATNAEPASPSEAALLGGPDDTLNAEPIELPLADALNVYAVAGRDGSGVSLSELQKWFTPVAGHTNLFRERGIAPEQKTAVVEIWGPARLNWDAELPLRLWLREQHAFKLQMWNGSEGVLLRYLNAGFPQSLVAYRTTRTGNSPVAETLAASASDGQRLFRAVPDYGEQEGPARLAPMMDLRWDAGRLIVNCGDVVLLSVAMPRKPDEVYFDGMTVLQSIGTTPAVSAAALRPESLAWSVERDIPRPAGLDWIADRPAGADLLKGDDGTVTLVSRNTQEMAWASMPIPRDAICEVVLELDGVEPGTGVYLGDAQGAMRYAVGFYGEKGTNRTVAAAGIPGTPATEEIGVDPNWQALYAGRHLWMRLFVAGDILRYWLSADGISWAECLYPGRFAASGYETLGLYNRPCSVPRSITLRRVILRKLPLMTALADPDLVKRAKSLPVAGWISYGEWLQRVCAEKPGGVDAAAWARACAVRSLADGTIANAAPAILDRLLEEALEREQPLPLKVRLLNEASMLYMLPDGKQPDRLYRIYDALAQRAIAAGEERPYTRVAAATMTSPMWMFGQFRYKPDPLIRVEALNLAYAGQWEALYRLSRHVKFSRRAVRGAWNDLMQWSETLAAEKLGKALPGAAESAALFFDPVMLEPNKDQASNMGELEAAVKRQDYGEACRVIASSGSSGVRRGLLRSPGDSRWLISWPTALDMVMRDHPALRAAMRQDMATEARLRVRQAMDAGDRAGVELEALRYHGTEAAGEAYAWLGDHAMLEAAPARANGYYRMAFDMGDEKCRQRAKSGLLLAEAMMGRKGTQPQDASFGSAQINAADLEALRQQRAAAGVDLRPSGAALLTKTTTPPPGRYEASAWAKCDGETGSLGFYSEYSGDVDWAARQISLVVDGNRLLLASGFQVAAYDLGSGAVQWYTPLVSNDRNIAPSPGPAQVTMPCRPLLAPGRIYMRRMTARGPYAPIIPVAPCLTCLDSATGKALWTTDIGSAIFPGLVVSDPVLVQGELLALVARVVANTDWMLTLATFDQQTGVIVDQHDLVPLREGWQSAQVFQMTVFEDAFIANCLGTVLCFDTAGELRWARQELKIPPELNDWRQQWQDPPIVDGELCYIAQPGVQEVLCVEAATGRTRWRQTLHGIRRIAGVTGGRLIVQTDKGFLSFDAATGQVQWRHNEPSVVLSAQLCGQTGGFVYARREEVGPALCRPVLVWLDPATGAEQGASPIDSLRQQYLRLGPMIPVGDQVLALSRNPSNDMARDIVSLAWQGELPAAQATTKESVWVGDANPEMRRAAEKVLGDWTLFESSANPNTGYAAEWGGETNVLTTLSQSQLARRITVPAAGKPQLRVRVACEPGSEWIMAVDANGRRLAQLSVNPTSTGGGWKDFDVDLTPLAGQSVWVVIRAYGGNYGAPYARWSRIAVLE